MLCEIFIYSKDNYLFMIFEISFSIPSDRFWFYGQICVLIFLILYFAMMMYSKRKSQIVSQKEFYHGFAYFVLTCIIAQGSYILKILYEDLWHEGEDLEFFKRYIAIGGTGYEYFMVICFSLGFIFLMKPIEKYILNHEKLNIYKFNKISFLAVIVPYIGAMIYFEPPWNEYWTYVAYPGIGLFAISALISMFGSFIFYIRLGMKATGSIKKKGFLIGFGMILIYASLIIGSQVSQKIGGWAGAILGPGVMIIGGSMVLIGHRIQM
jgi:hypothetical protein